MSQARLAEDDEEEPKTIVGGAAGKTNANSKAGGGKGTAAGAGGEGKSAPGADGFTVSDAPQEMDVNMEYKELAKEGATRFILTPPDGHWPLSSLGTLGTPDTLVATLDT